MNTNHDYYYRDGYEFESSFRISFIEHITIVQPNSEHYDFKQKYKQYYFIENSQIDCLYGFNRKMDFE